MMQKQGLARPSQIVSERQSKIAINCTSSSGVIQTSSAINCNFVLARNSNAESTRPVSVSAADYARESLASNTRRAYTADLEHFAAWGGAIPASAAQVAEYLAIHAMALSAATLSRRLTALSKLHRQQNLPDPTTTELVRATFRGIRRSHGIAPKQAKALVREDLFLVLDALGSGIKARRDRALLLLGFAGGFRRSELVALNRADIEPVRQGLAVTIRRSKTDQFGQGRRIGIPHGRTRHCPVVAALEWFEVGAIESGPVFRPISRYGTISPSRLSGEAVALVVKERVAAAGIDPAGYSGHSLRSGFATSAAHAGVSSWKIRAQTGHKSEAMLSRYVREGELFTDNAVGLLL
jgi:integrase